MFGRTQNPSNQMVDIDLLPQVYVARRAFTLPFNAERGLWALIALGVLALGYQFTEWNALTARLPELQDKIAEAEIRAQVATVPKEVRDLQDRVNATQKRAEGLRRDVATIQRNQWPWGRIVALLVNLKPSAVQLTSVTHKEANTFRLEGVTGSETAVVTYAARLRDARLFSDVSIQALGTKQVPVDILPSAGGALVPGVVTPTPTPPFDYVLLSATRTAIEDSGPYHEIFGQVVDRSGRPMGGAIFEISSCCPIWTAQYPGPIEVASNGEFEFFVGPGVFTVQIVNAQPGRRQAAAFLSTLNAEPGTRLRWNIIFQRLTAMPLEQPLATPTFVPTPSGTPVFGPPAAQKTRTVPTATPTSSTPPPLITTPTLALQPISATPGGDNSGSPTLLPSAGAPTKTVVSFTITLVLSQQSP